MNIIQYHPRKHETLKQYWCNVGPASKTMDQHYFNTGLPSRVCWYRFYENHKQNNRCSSCLQLTDDTAGTVAAAAPWESYIIAVSGALPYSSHQWSSVMHILMAITMYLCIDLHVYVNHLNAKCD